MGLPSKIVLTDVVKIGVKHMHITRIERTDETERKTILLTFAFLQSKMNDRVSKATIVIRETTKIATAPLPIITSLPTLLI